MLKCPTLQCRKIFSKTQRTSYLLHTSVCGAVGHGRFSALSDNLTSDSNGEDDSSVIDDSDADPTYEPDVNETEHHDSPRSSPLTEQQRADAEFAGQELELFEKEMSFGLKNINQEILQPKKQSTTPAAKHKWNWCQFCQTQQSKIMRHMCAQHKDVEEIKNYLSIADEDKKKQSSLRKEAARFIINKSNEKFNTDTLDTNIGKPIVVKKSKIKVTTTSHVVCTACGGLISKHNFSAHVKMCIKRISVLKQKGDNPKSKFFCKELDKKYESLESFILNNQTKDDISYVCRTDPLILEYGRKFFKKHRGINQQNYNSSVLRTLADLFLRMKEDDPVSIKSFSDVLQPQHFESLIKVVNLWSKYDDIKGTCGVPSVPRRLCKPLKTCSYYLWSQAITNNSSAEEKAKVKAAHDEFTALMISEWPAEVGGAADVSLKTVQSIKKDYMPEASDVTSFFQYMDKRIETLLTDEDRSLLWFETLTQVVMAYLIVFNGRRPSEVQYCKIENYQKLIPQVGPNSMLSVFNVVAPKTKAIVPVLVTSLIKNAIDCLLEQRSMYVASGDLLFARQDGSAFKNPLNKFVSEIKMKKPIFFTANGLRHFWATNLQQNAHIRQHMPKFQGHSTQVHEKFYEMNLATISLNVIGPELLRNTHNLDEETDLNRESLQSVMESSEIPDMNNLVETRLGKRTHSNFNSTKKVCSSIINEPKTNRSTTIETKRDTYKDPNFNCPDEENSDSTSSDDDTSKSITRRFNKWTTPEKKELFEKLPSTVLGLKKLERGELRDVWENSTLIKRRHSLQMTRIKVSKYFRKQEKIPTPQKNKLFDKVNLN